MGHFLVSSLGTIMLQRSLLHESRARSTSSSCIEVKHDHNLGRGQEHSSKFGYHLAFHRRALCLNIIAFLHLSLEGISVISSDCACVGCLYACLPKQNVYSI